MIDYIILALCCSGLIWIVQRMFDGAAEKIVNSLRPLNDIEHEMRQISQAIDRVERLLRESNDGETVMASRLLRRLDKMTEK